VERGRPRPARRAPGARGPPRRILGTRDELHRPRRGPGILDLDRRHDLDDLRAGAVIAPPGAVYWGLPVHIFRSSR
jgi:hypothetical protein